MNKADKQTLEEINVLNHELITIDRKIEEIYENEDNAQYGKTQDRTDELQGLLEDKQALLELLMKKNIALQSKVGPILKDNLEPYDDPYNEYCEGQTEMNFDPYNDLYSPEYYEEQVAMEAISSHKIHR